ncbi:hypothetical protein CF326_g8114 [Tilletia indica]|nr:hypothetical protein CF326_g8114 [Tilletia indica]
MSSPEPMTNYRSGGRPPKAAFVLDESEDDIDESEDELFDGNESDSEADRLPRKQPDTQAASKAGVNHDHDECIVPFPNGNVWKVFTDTNACPDWSYHADWCWRNTQVLSVEDDDHGEEQGFGREEVERLMSGTVDFSQAQRAGFVSAYVRWRSALGAMQGLTMQRVQGNGNFVPKNKQDVFEKLIRGMLNAKSKDPITDYAAQLFDEFPGCYDWLTWWLSCDTAAMLFPGLTKMPLSRWKNLASSISALENLHSIYYLCWRTNMDLMCGLQCLQELAELLEAEHGAEGEGRATRYGKTGIRALRKKVKGRKGAEINDGRAPDANKHLKGSRVPPMAADADEFFSEDDSVQGTGLKIEREENAPEDRPSKRARPNGVGKTATTTISTFVSSTSKSRPQQSGSTARSVLGKADVLSYSHWRIVATSAYGNHFTALANYSHPIGPYSEAGVFSYNDFEGVARLRRGATDTSITEMLSQVPHSNCAVYVSLLAVPEGSECRVASSKPTAQQLRTRNALTTRHGRTVLGLQQFRIQAKA